MAFVIKDGCISCGACAGQCPVGAISEGDGKYEIDADKCVSCGACAAQCPVGAIEEGQEIGGDHRRWEEPVCTARAYREAILIARATL